MHNTRKLVEKQDTIFFVFILIYQKLGCNVIGMSDTKKSPTRDVVKNGLPTLEQKLRARLRFRVVQMYDTAVELVNLKAAEQSTSYGKAANE